MGSNIVSKSIVSLKSLKKSYFSNVVFNGLDLNIEPGNFYALLGKNGSGKSTLIRILAHQETADSGSCEVLGVNLDNDFADKGNEIGFISEATLVPPDQKVSSLIEIYSKTFKKWDANEADRLVKGFRLDVNKKAGQLSRGQLVQMALVLNLSYFPSLILLDEVTAVLDAGVRKFLMDVLTKRVQIGATVILATNIVTEVQNIANQLVLIGDKKIKVSAPTQKISDEFYKLTRNKNLDHAVFSKDSCIEVGLSISGEPQYLVSKKDISVESISANMLSNEPITPVEVFVYLTRLRD
ncbi:MAG: ABC transporter ATP-binding protein [Oligoflexia bacterium]|nr:ABC transporter ATP-binding protein [Oligoflexia bacterium]